jgi:glucokinase
MNLMDRHLGIEIGGTKLQIVVGDGSARILERHRFDVDRERGGPGIREQIQAALTTLIPAQKPAALGVGFGGPVDWRTGRICCSHQIEGWSDFPLGEWLHSLTARPVVVDNDANTATLGEASVGAGTGLNPVFYVTLGSGVGGGLVVDGRIYHGARPGEAEIGHLRLDRRGTIVEERCSGWAVDARIRRLRQTRPESLLARMTTQATGGEARFLAPAIQQGDATARDLLAEVAEELAFGLSQVVHLFHPELIVMGGGLSLVGEPLRLAVAEALPAFVMDAFQPGPQVRLAALGEDAVPTGALLLARGVAACGGEEP